jgi:hypothetical protein
MAFSWTGGASERRGFIMSNIDDANPLRSHQFRLKRRNHAHHIAKNFI